MCMVLQAHVCPNDRKCVCVCVCSSMCIHSVCMSMGACESG